MSYIYKFLIGTLVLLISSCAELPYYPQPIHENWSFSNTQTKTREGITITTSVLTESEAQMVFGVPIVENGVEPVWIKIENNDDIPYFIFPIEIDPNYYSAREAARKGHLQRSTNSNEEVDRYFIENEIPKYVRPGKTISGFVYTEPDIGVKQFKVKLLGPGVVKRAYFIFPEPGLKLDFEDLDAYELYMKEDIELHDDEEALRKALEELPCCTTNKKASGDGDPLNLVVIGEMDQFLPYFIKRGWQVTEDIYVSSLFKEIRAFFFGSEYRYAPVSSLYVFGRGQDIALQKPRKNIYRRNHLRLWLTPIHFEGKPVWVGQISRDIGISFSTKNWWLSNHDIDPDVDAARNFLAQDMMLSHGVANMGYVRGMDPTTTEEPMKNFMDQPIFSDGLRLVLLFTDVHIDITDLELFHWEWPDALDIIRESQDILDESD